MHFYAAAAIKDGEKEFANLIQLLLFTGARRNEIMKAKWEYIDWYREVLVLPDSKTGPKEILLSAHVIQQLKKMNSEKINDWIIPGRYGNKPMNGPSRLWKRMCEETGLSSLRIHDLRHSFASTAVSSGGSLYEIGNLLGHTRPETTARYAHLMTDPERRLADKTGAQLYNWMQGIK